MKIVLPQKKLSQKNFGDEFICYDFKFGAKKRNFNFYDQNCVVANKNYGKNIFVTDFICCEFKFIAKKN